ncbi:MAG: nucleotidyltransferase domain-containing protein [Acidobacteriia bacterium]|nr:nucleotidyltransferase domain-containing protein [Terriglobia bacterium]MBZ5655793.1 nucleotidyltransferase domain-containing protein [Terriglobia bacterium]
MRALLLSRVRELGRDPVFLRGADEIVIFGSHAAGLETPDSDLDVLCVGLGRRLKTNSLDLCWVSKETLFQDGWLGSELAGHIARYGTWVHGEGDWRRYAFVSMDAIERKRKRIVSLSRTVTNLWDRL